MITVIDYGMGNLGSVLNMLKKVGASARSSSEPDVLMNSEALVLPGVGAFDAGMENLAKRGLVEILNDLVLVQKRPILGICLGVQLFTNRSDEGILPGLGWIDAEAYKFSFSEQSNPLRVPHMGWNEVTPEYSQPILPPISANAAARPYRFYFVHSYYLKCNRKGDILAKTQYGFDFTSAVLKDNILGVQFHPEKSHRFGMTLIKNFLDVMVYAEYSRYTSAPA
jgi:glutamine amidotransferase